MDAKKWKVAVWVAVAAMLVSTAWAAEYQTGKTPAGQAGKEFSPQLLNAESLIGAKVTNPQGENLGRINDVVLNSRCDAVSYVAVHYGGLWGMGGKMFAVPWQALTVQPSAQDKIDKVTVNISKTDLDQSPGFNRNSWPTEGEARWQRATTTMPGAGRINEKDADRFNTGAGRIEERNVGRVDVSKERVAGGQLCRISEFVGLNVKNMQDQDLGDIEDVVLDLYEGRPVYAVLSFGGTMGFGSKMASVPWDAFHFMPQENVAHLDSNIDTLNAIAYRSNNPPNLASEDEAARLHRRFNLDPYWEIYGYKEPTTLHDSGTMIDAWKADSAFNKHFDANKIVTKSGTVTSVSSFSPAAQNMRGLRLVVRTDAGESFVVYGGPRDYVLDKGFMFYNGDKVEVTGSQATINNRPVIMATEIKSGDKTLQLRNREGKPQWKDEDLMKFRDQMNGGQLDKPDRDYTPGKIENR
jgi:sporulation protein YlmC with PRC-barrel domain